MVTIYHIDDDDEGPAPDLGDDFYEPVPVPGGTDKSGSRWERIDHLVSSIWTGMKGDLMNTRHTSVTETDFDTQSMMEFFRTNPVQNHVRFSKSYNIKDGQNRVVDWFMARMDAAVFQVYEKNRRIQGFTKDDRSPVHVEVSYQDKTDGIISTSVEMFGEHDVLLSIQEALNEAFQPESAVPLQWWYKSDRGVTHRKVFLPALTTEIVPELYPDIQPDPSAYIRDYLASDASILLMAGPPGTGKTTLLRHMLKEHNLGAHVIYDESIMSNDNIFQEFLFGMGDVMIIEDADTLLCSREHDQNKLMSRFLNVSDGLIKLPNKKLVFTTNISDFNKVDPAIIRPGRCYGVLHTRPLDLPEAQAAAKACKLPIPTRKDHFTLAQLFNQGTQSYTTRGIGFVTA